MEALVHLVAQAVHVGGGGDVGELGVGIGVGAVQGLLRVGVGVALGRHQRLLDLPHVGRIGSLAAGRHVGDLAVVRGGTHRHRVGAIGERALAQRDSAGCRHGSTLAQRHRVGGGGGDRAVGAHRGAAVGIHPGVAADGGVVGAGGMAVAAKRGGMIAAGGGRRTDRQPLGPGQHAGIVAAVADGVDRHRTQFHRALLQVADLPLDGGDAAVQRADRCGVGTDRGGVVAQRGAGQVELCLQRVELVEIHRVGALGTSGHIGDLALEAGAAHRHRVGAIGQRLRAQRHRVVGGGLHPRARTQRGAIDGVGPGQPAERRGVVAGGVTAGAQRGRADARRLGDELPAGGAATHGHALVAAGGRVLAHRHAAGATGRCARAAGQGVVTDRHRVVAQRRAQEARRDAVAA